MITLADLHNMKYVYQIHLNTFEKIHQFINYVAALEGELYLYSDDKIIIARSIIGIFTLNLLEPIQFYSNKPIDDLCDKDLCRN